MMLKNIVLFTFFFSSTLYAQTFSIELSQEPQWTELIHTIPTSRLKLPILYRPEGLSFICNQQDADLLDYRSFQVSNTSSQTFLLLNNENKIDSKLKARIAEKNDHYYHALAIGAINTTSAKIYTRITCVKNPQKIKKRIEQEKKRKQEEEEKRKAQQEKEEQDKREKEKKEKLEKEKAEKKKKAEEVTPQVQKLKKFFSDVNIKKICPPADKINVDALVKICARGFLNDQYRTTTEFINKWGKQNGLPLKGQYCGYNAVTGELNNQYPWKAARNALSIAIGRDNYGFVYGDFSIGQPNLIKPSPRYPRYDFYGTYIFLVDIAPGVFVACDDFSFDSKKQFITYSAVAISILFDSDKIKFSEMINQMKDLPKEYADLKIFLNK